MYCPQCGKELEKDARFCTWCGSEVSVQDKVSVNQDDVEEVSTKVTNLEKEPENLSNLEEESTDLSNQDKVSLFIGQNQGYFMRKWQQESSWNWAAFFLTAYWLGYRKLYTLLFITLGFYITISALSSLLLPLELTFIGTLLCIPINFYLGMKGNTIYKNQLNKKLAKIDAVASSKQEKVELIRKAGGTSIGGVFTALGIGMAAGIIITILMLKYNADEFFPTEIVFGTGTYELGIIEETNTFNPNDEIIMEMYLLRPIGTSEVEFVVYREEDYTDEPYMSWTSPVDPTWLSLMVQVAEGLEWGHYTLKVLDDESVVIAEGSFTVE